MKQRLLSFLVLVFLVLAISHTIAAVSTSHRVSKLESQVVALEKETDNLCGVVTQMNVVDLKIEGQIEGLDQGSLDRKKIFLMYDLIDQAGAYCKRQAILLVDMVDSPYLANFDFGNMDRIYADIGSGDSKVVIVDRATESPILELDMLWFFHEGAFIKVFWSQIKPDNAFYYDADTGITVTVLLVDSQYLLGRG